MIIGFVGDVHGRVFLALAALATWQARAGRRFDLLVQVGDLGAYPATERMDVYTQRYLEADSSEADFSRLLQADGARAGALRRLRERFGGPIYFPRGNHEDFDWLGGLPLDAGGTARVDPFDLFRYVPDGSLLDMDGCRIAFLGGAEEFGDTPAGIDNGALASLMELAPGTVDLLVTHQGPYGLGVGHYGDVQGSRLVTELVERLQPPWHVAGHRHVLDGPLAVGSTTYLGLAGLVASARWEPEARGLLPGCLAVLDSATGAIEPATDDWLRAFDTPIDFDGWWDRLSASS